MTIGQRIASARERARLSAAALARAASVDAKTVWRWENNRAVPEALTVPLLADALHVSLRWLLTGVDDAAPEALSPTGTES